MVEISLQNPLTIYHLEGRRSFRVVWLCEELGLPYRLIFKRGDLLGSMKMIREQHRLMPVAPTIKYGNDFIVESAAILELIQTRHGGGRFAPSVESSDFPFHLQWLHFAESSLGARISGNFAAAQATGVTPDKLPKGYRASGDINEMVVIGTTGVFEYMEDFLSRRAYFGCADFTIADISMHWMIRIAKLLTWIYLEDYPNVAKWTEIVEARPAFKRATLAATPGGADEYGMPLGIPLAPFTPRPARV